MVAQMSVISDAHASPTRLASGGRLSAWGAQRACQPIGLSLSGRFHHPPDAFLSPVGIARPTTCHQGLPNQRLWVFCVIVPYSATGRRNGKGDGHSSQCLKIGVSWPEI